MVSLVSIVMLLIRIAGLQAAASPTAAALRNGGMPYAKVRQYSTSTAGAQLSCIRERDQIHGSTNVTA